jgi:hypothetical protein
MELIQICYDRLPSDLPVTTDQTVTGRPESRRDCFSMLVPSLALSSDTFCNARNVEEQKNQEGKKLIAHSLSFEWFPMIDRKQ